MLRHRANIYPFVPAQDIDGGNDPANCYPSQSYTAVRCLGQHVSTEALEDDAGRVTQFNKYAFIFGDSYGINLRDRIDFYDPTTPTNIRTVYVVGRMNSGGRSAVWHVDCEDKQ
jgi:hypothetical protein